MEESNQLTTGENVMDNVMVNVARVRVDDKDSGWGR